MSKDAMFRFLWLALLLAAACVPQAPIIASPTPNAAALPGLAPTPEITLTRAPGLIVRGHVRLKSGPELAGVKICRNYAAYPGVVVATTDTAGYFQSDFAFIPGDEMVGVWPLAEGYVFEPPFVSWRHYHGSEERTIDFVASPSAATAMPPGACS
jgi:hypothetical protein